MIAGADVKWLPAHTAWPMHTALRELDEETGRRGLRSALGVAFSFEPSPEVGLAERGADGAFRDLILCGLLIPEGAMLDAGLRVDQAKLVGYRRAFMRLEPVAAALLQRAGSRWVALASTAAKKPEAPRVSVGPMVASGTV